MNSSVLILTYCKINSNMSYLPSLHPKKVLLPIFGFIISFYFIEIVNCLIFDRNKAGIIILYNKFILRNMNLCEFLINY